MKRYLICFAALVFVSGCANEEAVVESGPETEHGGMDEQAFSDAAEEERSNADHAEHEHTKIALTADNTQVQFTGVKKSGDSHSGGFKTLAGEIEICEGSMVGLTVAIETESLFSDAEKLTGHLKNEDFFSVKEFPEMKFESTSIKGDAEVTVTGMLTMHGETAEISFPATVTVDGESLQLASAFKVDRTKFGMNYVGKPDDPILPEVDIKVSVAVGE